MIENEFVQQLAFFGINFASILVKLLFYAVFGWVVANWFVMFGLIKPGGRIFSFLTQLVTPVLRPFRWAKIGMIDLSPIAAILVLDLALNALKNGLSVLVG